MNGKYILTLGGGIAMKTMSNKEFEEFLNYMEQKYKKVYPGLFIKTRKQFSNMIKERIRDNSITNQVKQGREVK